MKTSIIILTLFMRVCCAYAQTTISEKEIRSWEDGERKAMLARDTVALNKYWADDFTVNTPANRITHSKRELFNLVLSGIFNYTSFTRHVEEIFVKGDVVITMGSEEVVPIGDVVKVGQKVKRRYTNIWMKQNGTWKLTARHANEFL